MHTYIRYEQADPPRAIELAILALSLDAMLPDIDALPADTLRQRVRTLAVNIQSGEYNQRPALADSTSILMVSGFRGCSGTLEPKNSGAR